MLSKLKGQTAIKNVLQDMIKCYKKGLCKFPHTLLVASAGQGKTTLAKMLASELNPNYTEVFGPALSTADALVNVLKSSNEILFVDEIHAIPKEIQELMYSVMTNGKVARSDGGYDNVAVKTIIGATTDPQMMLIPLKERFINTMVFAPYSKEDLVQCLLEHFNFCTMDIISQYKIAELAHGTPRKLLALVEKLKYFMGARDITRFTKEYLNEFMSYNGLDKFGFDTLQQKYVNILKQYKKPCSLTLLSAMMSLRPEVITQMIEPDVVRAGVVKITSKGRIYEPE